MFHLYKSQSNAVASSNIWSMLQTLVVFQLEISWLKLAAPWNMWSVFLALLVSQQDISWLKDRHLMNVALKNFTLATF